MEEMKGRRTGNIVAAGGGVGQEAAQQCQQGAMQSGVAGPQRRRHRRPQLLQQPRCARTPRQYLRTNPSRGVRSCF